MNISKKKKEEFDSILNFVKPNNIIINIDLFREKLFNSDFYDIFIDYSKNKIENIAIDNEFFYLHVNIVSFKLSDLYHYDKILKISKLFHKFTKKLKKIFIYGSSNLFQNLISMLNESLNFKIEQKFIFKEEVDMIVV